VLFPSVQFSGQVWFSVPKTETTDTLDPDIMYPPPMDYYISPLENEYQLPKKLWPAFPNNVDKNNVIKTVHHSLASYKVVVNQIFKEQLDHFINAAKTAYKAKYHTLRSTHLATRKQTAEHIDHLLKQDRMRMNAFIEDVEAIKDGAGKDNLVVLFGVSEDYQLHGTNSPRSRQYHCQIFYINKEGENKQTDLMQFIENHKYRMQSQGKRNTVNFYTTETLSNFLRRAAIKILEITHEKMTVKKTDWKTYFPHSALLDKEVLKRAIYHKTGWMFI